MTPEQRTRYHRNLKAVDDLRKDLLNKQREQHDRDQERFRNELTEVFMDIARTRIPDVPVKTFHEPSRISCHCGTVHYSDESCPVCASERDYDRRHL